MAETQERIKNRVATHLLEAGCVVIKSKPSFRWASGLHSPIYTDNRLLLSDPRRRHAVATAFLDVIKQEKLRCDVVAGVATSGIPMATILAERLGKPLVYVRPQAKAHGKGRQIEGAVKKGARVLLIEDLISTGGSSLNAARALRKAGAKLDTVLAIFAYLPALAQRRFARSRIQLQLLTDVAAVLRVGRRRQRISAKAQQATETFLDQLAAHLK